MLSIQSPPVRRWFVAGDINGFFGLIFDNLSVLSFLAGILIFAFGFPADVVFTRMFPGTALGVLFGDLVYTWMAIRLMRKTGRDDVTAMPLGLDTPSTIGLALVVLGPAFLEFKQHHGEHDAAIMTWQLGMATMLFMGVFKLICSFFGRWVQNIVPRAGLLGSLAGIAIALIGFPPLIDIFGMPLVGLVSLGLVLYTLVARLQLPWKIPGVLASVVVGTLVYYAGLLFQTLTHTTIIGGGAPLSLPPLHLHLGLPMPTMQFLPGLAVAIKYLPLSIPFALLTVVGGVNVTESARAAGDDYNTRDILLTEAVATLIAGVCGGVAQSTPYIGHPAYKNMGSRAGYTLLTGIVFGLGGMLGFASFIVQAVPRAILAPILVFVALDIVIQAFNAVPRKHGAAVALTFFPTIARLLAIKLGNPALVTPATFDQQMTAPGPGLPELQVIVAVGNGFILTAMLWGAFLARLIDRHIRTAAAWLLALAVLSFFGIIHSALPDGSLYLPWHLAGIARQIPFQFAAAYAVLAAMYYALSFTRATEAGPPMDIDAHG